MILTPKNVFSKHKNNAEIRCLDVSEVLSSDFPGLKTSVASVPFLSEAVETTEVIEAAEVLRPVKSLLRTSEPYRFLNSVLF